METSYEIRRFVARKIAELQSDSPSARGNLAKLRRGLGKDISESIESWEFVYKDLPDELSGKNNVVSKSEQAIHLTLTLFAMHQQGNNNSVHIKGKTFGESISEIIKPDKSNEDAVIRRFNTLITSDGISELSIHLRSMINLIKSSDFVRGFDYEQFATDLYYFQFSEGMRNVKISWGKEFYKMKKTDNKTEESD